VSLSLCLAFSFSGAHEDIKVRQQTNEGAKREKKKETNSQELVQEEEGEESTITMSSSAFLSSNDDRCLTEFGSGRGTEREKERTKEKKGEVRKTGHRKHAKKEKQVSMP